MAATFTKIYIQVVFAVQWRQALISPDFKDDLFKYMTGIIRNKKQKMIVINGMPDHVHMLIGQKPNSALSSLVGVLKVQSANFVNENKLVKGRFSWQEGFGGFSYSESQIDSVCRYIQNQEKHHRARKFRDEYLELLRKFRIEHDEKHTFDWMG